MRILVTGAAGMLGSSVYPTFVAAGHEVHATDLAPRMVAGLPMDALDVRDFAAVRDSIERLRPDMVLHLAAETDLEVCEADPDHAYRTNALGTQNVVIASGAHQIPVVYISTAGVFDGTKSGGPYTELDAPNPINVYGRSKYEGELLVRHGSARHFIVRAGWMIGGHERDHKFVAKIIQQLQAGATTIRAVDDKLGTPTYTADFAANLLELVGTPYYGLYHMACLGEGSRYDVAREIVAFFGRSDVSVVAVTSDVFKDEYPAARPRSEIMRNYMLDLRGMNRMRAWQASLAEYLRASNVEL